jgi:2-oxoglutarate ferredoxin oxidoreductase subunit gamma
MSFNMLFAGFGGQGIQFAAKIMAYTGMIQNNEVSLLPSYGPEMRGGTSNCSVCIDANPIASPLVTEPMQLFALNTPSFLKFIDSVAPGGTVIYDSFLITAGTDRKDIALCPIPATKIAKEEGLGGLANIIALGYFIKKTDVATLDEVIAAIKKAVPATKAELIEKNIKALNLGYSFN